MRTLSKPMQRKASIEHMYEHARNHPEYPFSEIVLRVPMEGAITNLLGDIGGKRLVPILARTRYRTNRQRWQTRKLR